MHPVFGWPHATCDEFAIGNKGFVETGGQVNFVREMSSKLTTEANISKKYDYKIVFLIFVFILAALRR